MGDDRLISGGRADFAQNDGYYLGSLQGEILTGGSGNDIFEIEPVSSTNGQVYFLSTFSVINDLEQGDRIKLKGQASDFEITPANDSFDILLSYKTSLTIGTSIGFSFGAGSNLSFSVDIPIPIPVPNVPIALIKNANSLTTSNPIFDY